MTKERARELIRELAAMRKHIEEIGNQINLADLEGSPQHNFMGQAVGHADSANHALFQTANTLAVVFWISPFTGDDEPEIKSNVPEL